MAILLGIFAESIAKIFSKNPKVIERTVLYIRIVPIAYGFQGIMEIGTNILNVLKKPFKVTAYLYFSYSLSICHLPILHLSISD